MMYDVIVIGAGPAGLSAAINVRQRGGSVCVVGTAMSGNPLWSAEKIDNYLGLPGKTGQEMMEIFREHAEAMQVEFVKERVLNAFSTGDHWMISAGSEVLEGYAVVFAGGIMRGKAYPGETEHIGRGVSYCATCDGMLYRKKAVAVIGFSAADQEEAEYLKSIGCSVSYFERPKQVEIKGEPKVDEVVVDGTSYPVSCVFVLRPTMAPSSLFPGIALSGNYVNVDREQATNLPGLYAAGDCTGAPLQVAKSVGEGLIAGQKAMAYASTQKKKG